MFCMTVLHQEFNTQCLQIALLKSFRFYLRVTGTNIPTFHSIYFTIDKLLVVPIYINKSYCFLKEYMFESKFKAKTTYDDKVFEF